jgi:hypothetical protein
MLIRGILFDAAGVFYRRPESTGRYVANLLVEMGLPAELLLEHRQTVVAIPCHTRTPRGVLAIPSCLNDHTSLPAGP